MINMQGQIKKNLFKPVQHDTFEYIIGSSSDQQKETEENPKEDSPEHHDAEKQAQKPEKGQIQVFLYQQQENKISVEPDRQRKIKENKLEDALSKVKNRKRKYQKQQP